MDGIRLDCSPFPVHVFLDMKDQSPFSQLTAMRARISMLEKQVQARDAELIALPSRYQCDNAADLAKAIEEAVSRTTPAALPVKTRSRRKAKPRHKAKSVQAPAAKADTVVAAAPKPIETAKRADRTKVTPELISQIIDMGKAGKTVAQINKVTNLAPSTIFRLRGRLRRAGTVVTATPAASSPKKGGKGKKAVAKKAATKKASKKKASAKKTSGS